MELLRKMATKATYIYALWEMETSRASETPGKLFLSDKATLLITVVSPAVELLLC